MTLLKEAFAVKAQIIVILYVSFQLICPMRKEIKLIFLNIRSFYNIKVDNVSTVFVSPVPS